jgi:hypothetical protein
LTCGLTHVHLLFIAIIRGFVRAGIELVDDEFYAQYHNSESATAPLVRRRHTMWVIEINFAGHQFTHLVHDRRRPLFRFATRGMGWRPPQLRNQHAA